MVPGIICLSPGVTMSPGAKQWAAASPAQSFALTTTTCNYKKETFHTKLKVLVGSRTGNIHFYSIWKSLFLRFVALKYPWYRSHDYAPLCSTLLETERQALTNVSITMTLRFHYKQTEIDAMPTLPTVPRSPISSGYNRETENFSRCLSGSVVIIMRLRM